MLEVFLDTCGNSLSFNGQNIIDGVNVEGKGENIGGVLGGSYTNISGKVVLQNSIIQGTTGNSNKVGGAIGLRSGGSIYNILIKNTKNSGNSKKLMI